MVVILGKQFDDKLYGFVELVGQQFVLVCNGGKFIIFDIGVSYLLSDSVQVDGVLFFGLNKISFDLGWMVGLLVKF